MTTPSTIQSRPWRPLQPYNHGHDSPFNHTITTMTTPSTIQSRPWRPLQPYNHDHDGPLVSKMTGTGSKNSVPKCSKHLYILLLWSFTQFKVLYLKKTNRYGSCYLTDPNFILDHKTIFSSDKNLLTNPKIGDVIQNIIQWNLSLT